METTTEDILAAVKLIAATAPGQVEPFSVIKAGGVKLISASHLQDDTIIISDNIYRKLKLISDKPPTHKGK